MKTITFFSEKGGVGKSTFSIMFASWLHHKMGVKVALADFNSRILFYREAEKNHRNVFLKKNPDSPLQPYDDRTTWPIIDCKAAEIAEIKRNGSRFPYATWFAEEIAEGGRLSGYDIVLCDFPGSLTGGEFMQLSGMNYLSLIVTPTEKDEMTLHSTIRLHNTIKDKNHCVFINKAQLGLKNFRGSYIKLGELLTKKGLPVLPDLVSYSERIMTIDKVDIIRSTFGFPDFSLPEFGLSKDLGIINLFVDVSRELAKCPDLKGTGEADMSFVEELDKQPDGRQLKNSAFPQYEI